MEETCKMCDGTMTEVLRQGQWVMVCDNESCETNCNDGDCPECLDQ